MVLFRDALNRLALAEKNRRRYSFVRDHPCGANDLRLLAFRKNDPLGVAHGSIDYSAHYSARPSESCLELLAVLLEVDHLLCHAAGNCRPGDRRRHPEQYARIEWERDQVVGTELDRAESVQLRNALRDILLGQRRERSRRGHLHFLIYLSGASVERSAEDEREAEHVVHLIGKIAAAGRNDSVGAYCANLIGKDLGLGIGEGEDDGLLGHPCDHLAVDGASDREAHEYVCSD